MPSNANQEVDGEKPADREARTTFGDISSLTPAIIAGGAALAYGLLIVPYSEFYAELGVRPSEVGLELGPGLGGIVGVAVLLTLAAIILFLYTLVFGSRRPAPRSDSGKPETGKKTRTSFPGPLIIGGLIAVVVIGLFLMDDAREAAEKARAGKHVGPLTLVGLEVVAIRADPAEVRPANEEAARSETYLDLRDQTSLMYLGRSGSTLVLYDPSDQSSWKIPASAFTVKTFNCDTNIREEDRDSRCLD
jgi:hypothetical protein